MQCKEFPIKVFVEDTDFQGFVYHANYIKYFERARTQFLNDYNFSQSDAISNGLYVIKKLNILFSLPAKLEDELVISTRVEALSRARLEFSQVINFRDNYKKCCEGLIEVCFLDKINKKPIAFDSKLLKLINNHE